MAAGSKCARASAANHVMTLFLRELLIADIDAEDVAHITVEPLQRLVVRKFLEKDVQQLPATHLSSAVAPFEVIDKSVDAEKGHGEVARGGFRSTVPSFQNSRLEPSRCRSLATRRATRTFRV